MFFFGFVLFYLWGVVFLEIIIGEIYRGVI